MSAVTRVTIPRKARSRDCVPWQLSIGRELTREEMTTIVGLFLEGTELHKVISGDVYPGLTILNGDYWAPKGKGKDLSQVARRWDEVADKVPELVVDATLEYRVTSSLQDEVAPIEV